LLSCRSVSASLTELPRLDFCPRLRHRASSIPFLLKVPLECPCRHQDCCRHQSRNPPANQRAQRREADSSPEASTQDAQAGINRLGFGPAKQTRTGMDPDFRALLRLSSRSLPGTVRHPEKPMLSWPSSPSRPTSSTVGLAPSPRALPTRPAFPLPKELARNRITAPQGISSRTWGRLRRATPTSMRSSTSSAYLSIPSAPHIRQRPGECTVDSIG
jgi:hypothetical protein